VDTLKTAIVNSAFREGNLVPVGKTPTPVEAAEGLVILNEFLLSLFGTVAGKFFVGLPLPIPDDFRDGLIPNEDPNKPLSNRRIFLSNTSVQAVAFPLRPTDGGRMAVVNVASSAAVTLSGNGKFIDPGDRTFSTSFAFPGNIGEYYEWFYRADLGMWVLIRSNNAGPFTSLDSSPFPSELDTLLITGLSLRLQTRYGNDPLQGTVDAFTKAFRNAKSRYSQTENKIVNPQLPISPSVIDMYGVNS